MNPRSDSEAQGLQYFANVHGGKGTLGVKYLFDTAEPASPAILMMYILPPGSSEGAHTHRVGDAEEGSYDEYYYIVSGQGEMQIEGERRPVQQGDHIFTPNGVAHGIENTAVEGDLTVYLVALRR